MQKKNKIINILILGCLSVMTLSFVYPFLFIFINSIKTRAQYYISPFGIALKDICVDSYISMFANFKILHFIQNTAVITICTSILLLCISIVASYAFAKLKFKGSNWIYFGIVAQMAIPVQVTLIPMYVIFGRLNLTDKYLSVIVIYLATYLGGNILLMTSYFKGISGAMLEAGRIDGCNYFQIIKNVIIPMGKSVIIISFILNFIAMWNDLLTPMIFLQRTSVRTVMVALAMLATKYYNDPPFQFAGLILSALPALLIYVVFQKHIIQGITMGSIK